MIECKRGKQNMNRTEAREQAFKLLYSIDDLYFGGKLLLCFKISK